MRGLDVPWFRHRGEKKSLCAGKRPKNKAEISSYPIQALAISGGVLGNILD